ncbi:MAG: FG-GAP repeat protein [Thermoanaerobaculia bacterium]|nr:FG-GAP repeat protein [Thermoanaerobaculia bacterium]
MKNPLACLPALCLGLGAAPLLAQPTITYLHENAPWVQDDAREGEAFGGALAAGDFNADGLPDLVVGVPFAQSGALLRTGAVHVMYSRRDLGPFPFGAYLDQFLVCSEAVEAEDQFGYAFAVGDFDGDGVDDLAIGAPGDGIGSAPNAGLVIVKFGQPGYGLNNSRCQKWHQDRPSVAGEAEANDRFGETLAAGDFNGDGVDDLAIGVPSEGLTGAERAGSVQVFRGQWGVGLVTTGALWIKKGASLGGYALPGTPTLADELGKALTAGDFNGDGVDDLAIGIPSQDTTAGAVQVVMGFWSVGLTGNNQRLLTQADSLLPDVAEPQDLFGSRLAAGDFNADGFDDLAVGAPGESVTTVNLAGAVQIFDGSLTGLRATLDFFTQNSDLMQDSAEAGDGFGLGLASGDFNADGFDDLVISAPEESLGNPSRIGGAFHLVNGSLSGLTTAGNRFWGFNSPGVGSAANPLGRFGFALAAADFDGDGADDLAVGAPFDDPGILNAGSVNVFTQFDAFVPILLFP